MADSSLVTFLQLGSKERPSCAHDILALACAHYARRRQVVGWRVRVGAHRGYLGGVQEGWKSVHSIAGVAGKDDDRLESFEGPGVEYTE